MAGPRFCTPGSDSITRYSAARSLAVDPAFRNVAAYTKVALGRECPCSNRLTIALSSAFGLVGRVSAWTTPYSHQGRPPLV